MSTATAAPDFNVPDQYDRLQTLASVMRGSGLLLGFAAGIWQPASVRRLLWLQKHAHRLTSTGLNVALVVCDRQSTLYGFHMSSPVSVNFPLLADANGAVHARYGMADQPGMVLVDPNGVLRQRWMMSIDRVWPAVNDLLAAAQKLS